MEISNTSSSTSHEGNIDASTNNLPIPPISDMINHDNNHKRSVDEQENGHALKKPKMDTSSIEDDSFSDSSDEELSENDLEDVPKLNVRRSKRNSPELKEEDDYAPPSEGEESEEDHLDDMVPKEVLEKDKHQSELLKTAHSEEQQDEGPIEGTEEARKVLRSMSEFAVCLQFFDIFKKLLGINDYSAEKLENSLVNRGGYSFMAKLHIKLLQRLVKRGSSAVTPETWERMLKNRINRELSSDNVLYFQQNPMESTPWKKLPINVKVCILRNLCEWQSDHNEKLQESIKEIHPNDYNGHLREFPVGTDKFGNLYWSVDTNELTARLYREEPPTWKGNQRIPGKWETVTTSLSELETFAKTFENALHKGEKELYKVITIQLLPPLIEQQKHQEAMTRKLLKMELSGVSMRNILTDKRARRSRKEGHFLYPE